MNYLYSLIGLGGLNNYDQEYVITVKQDEYQKEYAAQNTAPTPDLVPTSPQPTTSEKSTSEKVATLPIVTDLEQALINLENLQEGETLAQKDIQIIRKEQDGLLKLIDSTAKHLAERLLDLHRQKTTDTERFFNYPTYKHLCSIRYPKENIQQQLPISQPQPQSQPQHFQPQPQPQPYFPPPQHFQPQQPLIYQQQFQPQQTQIQINPNVLAQQKKNSAYTQMHISNAGILETFKQQKCKGDLTELKFQSNPHRAEIYFNELAQKGFYGTACALFHQLKRVNDANNFAFFGRTVFQQLRSSIEQIALKGITAIALTHKHVTFYNDTFTPLTWMFGNFYEGQFSYKGVTYKTTEAAFQAQKFLSNPKLTQYERTEIENAFKNASGDKAFELGHRSSDFSRRNLFNPQWDAISVQTMYEICKEKFAKDPFAQQALLATGNAILIEMNDKEGRDQFWSDNSTGLGHNMLGLILMDIREEFRGNTSSNYRGNGWEKLCPLQYPGLQNGYVNNGV